MLQTAPYQNLDVSLVMIGGVKQKLFTIKIVVMHE